MPVDCPDCDVEEFRTAGALEDHRRLNHPSPDAVLLLAEQANRVEAIDEAVADRERMTGRCPDCGAVVWAGGEPSPGQFPLVCMGVGCERTIAFQDAV
jgi:hypothetical protein